MPPDLFVAEFWKVLMLVLRSPLAAVADKLVVPPVALATVSWVVPCLPSKTPSLASLARAIARAKEFKLLVLAD